MARLAQPIASPSTCTDSLSRGTLIAAATIGTLVISRLPEIVLREGLGLSTPWLPLSTVAIAALLWLGARMARPLAPLSGYFAVMTAVSALLAALPVLFESPTWAQLTPPSAGPMVVLLSERLVLGAIGLAFVILLILVGGRAEAEYFRLRSSASSTAEALGETRNWSVAGLVAIVMLVALTALAMAPSFPSKVDLGAAAPFLVMAVLAAALNSFWEEAVFRAAPLGRLAPAIGAGPAIILLATWFGLGHFYGGAPSGPIGAVMVTLVGVVLGRAMADTRALAWPWAIHFSIDLTIYTVIALAAMPGA